MIVGWDFRSVGRAQQINDLDVRDEHYPSMRPCMKMLQSELEDKIRLTCDVVRAARTVYSDMTFD